jgi:parvulin-like peptidyl-prolyl isomerase
MTACTTMAMAQDESPAPEAAPDASAGETVTPPSERFVDPEHLPSPDMVIARVGDYSITKGAFDRDVALRWSMEIQAGRADTKEPPMAFRRRVLEEIISARLLRIMAANSGIEVTDEEVDADYMERRKRMQSEEAFQQHLRAMQMTEPQLKQEIRSRIQVERYKEKETAEVTVPDEAVQALYEELKEAGKMLRPAMTADVRHILIRPQGNDDIGWDNARARVEAARQRVLDGETFADVARDFSQDPVSAPQGGLYREALPDLVGMEIGTQMMTIPIGEVSEPFRSEVGWHIITVDARHEPGQIPFEDIEDSLRKNLLFEAKADRIAEIIGEAGKFIRVEMFPEDGA